MPFEGVPKGIETTGLLLRNRTDVKELNRNYQNMAI